MRVLQRVKHEEITGYCSTSYFLKNAIKDALDEFGDSLETNEKVAVLARVLAELVAGES